MHQDRHPSGPGREHRPQIDGLRFFAFLGIFLLHCNSGRFPAGQLGVPLFFALSGFLITRILIRNESDSPARDLATFYARRTLRIFPLYYAVLAALMACGQLARPWLSVSYLYNFCIYTNRAFVGRSGHFWTLAVEEQFYLIFPLILLATPARLRAWTLGGLLVACAGSRLLLERLAPNPFTFVLTNVAGEYLVAGAIAGYLDVARPGVPGSNPRLAGAMALSGFVALWASGFRFGVAWMAPILPDLAALAFAVLVWELWRCEGPIARALSLRPLAYLGKISYGCYVLHVYVIQYVYAGAHAPPLPGAMIGPAIPAGARVFAALAGTIVAAMASWHLLESPILALKSRFSYDRGPSRGRSSPTAPASRHPLPAGPRGTFAATGQWARVAWLATARRRHSRLRTAVSSAPGE